MTLVKWTAKRSGAAITIIGHETTAGGRKVQISVETIEGGAMPGAPAVAIGKDGAHYELA